MTTQAKLIRDSIQNILNNPDYLEKINSNPVLYGIRYKNLKAYLTSKEKFSEGAIVGALNTLTQRVPRIKKIKIKRGTYFFDYKFNRAELNQIDYYDIDFTKNIITIENDILKLLSKVRETLLDNTSFKKNTIQKNDVDYLINVLKALTKLRSITDEYENQKLYNNERKLF